MRIPRPAGAGAGRPPRRGSRLPWGLALGTLACAAALALSFVGYVQGYRRPGVNPGLRSPEGQRALVQMALAAPARLLSPFRPDPVERLQLHVSFQNFEKLRAKRATALEQGILVSTRDDFVPARLQHRGRVVPVRIRLKGDLADHLSGDKWSFRVEVRRGDTVLGMRRFSLQAPHTRAYHHEALFFDFLRDEGVLAPRYFFVDLSVNGDPIGRMALEEHFSSELLEHQSRRDSVIVRLDEQYFWLAELAFHNKVPSFDNWRNAPLDAFRRGRIDASPERTEQMKLAFGLLRGLQAGRLAPSQALDAELWGRFLAACEIWGTPHATYWNNLRFHLNALTLKLEPIAFDASGQARLEDGFNCVGGVHALGSTLVKDPRLRAAFLANLRRFAKAADSPDFERWLRAREAEYLQTLALEFPWLRPYPLEELRARARALAAVTGSGFARHLRAAPRRVDPRPDAAAFPTLVHASLARDARGRFVELANATALPVTLTAVGIQRNEGGLEPLPGRTTTVLRKRLPPTPWPRSPKLLRVEFPEPVPGTAAGDDWTVAGWARLGSREQSFRALESAPTLESAPLPHDSLAETLARHPFLRRNEDALVVDSGRFDVTGSIVLPPGVALRVGPGTTLRFGPDAMLLARGPLEFRGSAMAPIVLEGRPVADEPADWWGIVVLGDQEPSHWSHVVVRNTSGPRLPGWGITGGVTFHRTRATLEHCLFDGSRAEDALNLVRSSIALREVEIRHARSDALDVDFSQGRIEGGAIVDAGGDGIDLGGSRIEIVDVSLRGIGDKAVSVGEASDAAASRLAVEDARMGVVSKDRSTARVEDSRFARIEHVALLAYQKKSEFGPGELLAEGVLVRDAGRAAVAQLGSRVSLNGAEVVPEPLDVDALYDPGSSAR